jgi:hypothetical protein
VSLLTSPGFAPRRYAPSLDDPPSSPHAYDDEFDGVSLDPKWTRAGTFDDISAIDPYASFAGGHRTSLSYRQSWYMMQSAAAGGGASLYQSVILPTDCFIWARLSFNVRYSATVDNDSSVGIGLYADLSGSPDPNNRVYLYLNESDANTVQGQGGRVTAAVDASTLTLDVGPQTAGTDSLCQPACYIGIQKIGTTFNFFLGFPNGSWTSLTSQTSAVSLVYLILTFANTSSTAPGNMVAGCDFVRFLSGKYLP